MCSIVSLFLFYVSHSQIHPLLLQGNRTDTCKSRLLRRTISVPVETQFPELQCHLSVDNSECTTIDLHVYNTVKKKQKKTKTVYLGSPMEFNHFVCSFLVMLGS